MQWLLIGCSHFINQAIGLSTADSLHWLSVDLVTGDVFGSRQLHSLLFNERTQ